MKIWTNSISRNWSLVYGLSALIVDGRLAEHGSGPAEAIATRLTGRRAEAWHLLAPVHGWFTEGFNTPDLKEASGLLDELG